MKSFKIHIAIIFVVGLFSSVYYFSFPKKTHYTTLNENSINIINVKKDSIFSFNLLDGGGTSYVKCICSNLSNVKYLKTDYIVLPENKESKCEGCSNIEKWIFKAEKTGIDTIILRTLDFSICDKNCSYFSEDSLKLHLNDSIDGTAVKDFIGEEYKVIVKVED